MQTTQKAHSMTQRRHLLRHSLALAVAAALPPLPALAQGAQLTIPFADMKPGKPVDNLVEGGAKVAVTNDLTAKELEIIQSGGLLNTVRLS